MNISIRKIGKRVIVVGNDVKTWSKIRNYACSECGGAMVYSDKAKGWLCGEGNNCNRNYQLDWVDRLIKNDDNTRRANARARKKIIELCEGIGVDRMLTLTFQENVVDIDVALRAWKEFNRLMRKSGSVIQYVCVPELQKRGAIHFHVAINRYVFWNTVWLNWKRAVAVVSDMTGGVFINKRAAESDCGVARYIAKYVNKSMTGWIGKGRKRYYSNVSVAERIVKMDWYTFKMLCTGRGWFCQYSEESGNCAPDTFGYAHLKIFDILERLVSKLVDRFGVKKWVFSRAIARDFVKDGFKYTGVCYE